MLSGQEIRHQLRKELIEIKTALSTKLDAVDAQRKKISSEAAKLDKIEELAEFKQYLSPVQMSKIAEDHRIANLQAMVKKACENDTGEALAGLLFQVNTQTITIFSDETLKLHTQLLDSLRSLIIQAIKETLNNFYFEKVFKRDELISKMIQRADDRFKYFDQYNAKDKFVIQALSPEAPETEKIFSYIVRVKQEVEEFFLKNKISNLLNYRAIYFNDQASRIELSFSDELNRMPLPCLIQSANEVMWATEKAGLKKSYALFTELHNKPVGDKSFESYLKCEQWRIWGGYYWLTTVSQAKNLVEEKLTSQESAGFAEHRQAVSELRQSSNEKIATAESELAKCRDLESKIISLKESLINDARALATVNQHQNRVFTHVEEVEAQAQQKVSPVDEFKKPENVAHDLTEAELHEKLLGCLKFVLSDNSVKYCWSQQVKVTWGWNERVASYAVPTAIFRARTELDKSPVNLANVCQQFKERIASGTAPIQTPTQNVYRAFAAFLEGENLVVTNEKLLELKKVLLDSKLNFNGTCLGTDLAIEAILPAPRGPR